MATIKFGDYLKSKIRREAVYESDDSIAKRARVLIDADACAVKPQFRIDNYRRAIELLEQIPDHPDTEEMLALCRAGLESAGEDALQTGYELGKYHLESAQTEYEFRKSSDELKELAKELEERIRKGETPDTSPAISSGPASQGSETDAASGPSGPGAEAPADYREMLRKTEEMKSFADRKVLLYAKRTTRHRAIALAVLILAACAGIYAWVSGYGRYLAAKAEGMAGIYESAYSRFYKLGDYLDSRSQYRYYKEKYLRQREEEESRSLPEAEVGDTVEFSGFSWLVLEKDDTKLTLICRAPGKGSVYEGVSYDGESRQLREEMSIEPETDEAGQILADESVTEQALTEGSAREPRGERSAEAESDSASDDTAAGREGQDTAAAADLQEAVSSGSASWESSSLRSYLNETVLEHEFTPAETAAMELISADPTENEEYGTALAESVQDKISIPSVEQVASFLEDGVFQKPAVDMWLRTPGHAMDCAAYMTSSGNVILYGNDVADESLSACPLIVVDYAKLEG